MGREYWLISDTHFSHAKMLEWETGKRPFDSVQEMNEHMIQNWNSLVKPHDIVYHLGDVYFGTTQSYIDKVHHRLMGKKRLIWGNHDIDAAGIVGNNLFQKYLVMRKWPAFGIILSHIPINKESTFHKGEYLRNVHGHTHFNGSPPGDYKSVCVELTDYKPVNIEEVRKK